MWSKNSRFLSVKKILRYSWKTCPAFFIDEAKKSSMLVSKKSVAYLCWRELLKKFTKHWTADHWNVDEEKEAEEAEDSHSHFLSLEDLIEGFAFSRKANSDGDYCLSFILWSLKFISLIMNWIISITAWLKHQVELYYSSFQSFSGLNRMII